MRGKFVDPIGRLSDKPKDQERGITDNPNLFEGEYLLLHSLLGTLEVNDTLCVLREVYRIEVEPGLYHRHPQFLITENPELLQPNMVSHDEYNGLCFTDIATSGRYKIAQAIVAYGRKHFWQFADYYPKANFFKALFTSPIQTIRKLRAYLKDRKQNPQNLDAVDFRHSGDVVALTYLRQPRDTAFYKIAAGEEPSLFEILWLSLAIYLSSKRNIFDGSRGGTVLLAWFRMLAIRKAGYSHYVLNLAHRLFEERMVARFGHNYPMILAMMYFDRLTAEGEPHPIRLLIRKYVEKQAVDTEQKL